jgi:hypothetical protein
MVAAITHDATLSPSRLYSLMISLADSSTVYLP